MSSKMIMGSSPKDKFYDRTSTLPSLGQIFDTWVTLIVAKTIRAHLRSTWVKSIELVQRHDNQEKHTVDDGGGKTENRESENNDSFHKHHCHHSKVKLNWDLKDEDIVVVKDGEKGKPVNF
ncbi:hypothetical protein BGW80DRAFT_1248833 [Lactifluus volemus]|nr:hypothetical protein BGW80DRAFT_1248833 [Lactifluus volemus]